MGFFKGKTINTSYGARNDSLVYKWVEVYVKLVEVLPLSYDLICVI
jgi:hypothetical protein